jgi:hypothetical protein
VVDEVERAKNHRKAKLRAEIEYLIGVIKVRSFMRKRPHCQR